MPTDGSRANFSRGASYGATCGDGGHQRCYAKKDVPIVCSEPRRVGFKRGGSARLTSLAFAVLLLRFQRGLGPVQSAPGSSRSRACACRHGSVGIRGSLPVSCSTYEPVRVFRSFVAIAIQSWTRRLRMRRTLERGRRARETLNQPHAHPLTVPEQVASLLALTSGGPGPRTARPNQACGTRYF